MWMSRPDFGPMTEFHWQPSPSSFHHKSTNFTKALELWNRQVFRNIFRNKSRILRRLTRLEKAIDEHPSHYLLQLHQNLSLRYQQLLEQEEDFWKHKSRLDWMAQGDKNTKFFHTTTIIRTKRNRIDYVQNSQGEMISDPQFVKQSLTNFFTDILQTKATSSPFTPILSEDWNPAPLLQNIAAHISDQEIEYALFSIKPMKAPGPDRVHAIFFHKH